jgi:hypothetical protein
MEAAFLIWSKRLVCCLKQPILDGMAVGGRRRLTIAPELVCGATETGCYVLRPERQFVNEIPFTKDMGCRRQSD